MPDSGLPPIRVQQAPDPEYVVHRMLYTWRWYHPLRMGTGFARFVLEG